MMIRSRSLICLFVLFFAIGLASQQACAQAPVNLSPAGVTAFQNIQATKTLDLVRDLAVDGAHTGVMTRADALVVVNWHTAAIKTLDSRTQGWKLTITTGLDQAVPLLSQPAREKLAPYVALVKTVIASL